MGRVSQGYPGRVERGQPRGRKAAILGSLLKVQAGNDVNQNWESGEKGVELSEVLEKQRVVFVSNLGDRNIVAGRGRQ